MRRRITRAVVTAVASGLLLTACAGTGSVANSADDTPVSATPSETTPSNWPDGSSPESPRCQDTSAAVVAAVNALLTGPYVEGGQVDWLSAYPDPELGKWLLTGVLPSSGSEGGYFVVWATTANPTNAEFEGKLYSVGASSSISSAPPMTPAYVGASDMDDVPPQALVCGQMHTD